ncbi:hypothetical protein AB0I39_16935 [Kitasatospora purpeofusca]|uniref:hypothetical protein n=1 Tax=Kitasatospora purpeofusca TaxID=67352 RepID=UPI0033FC0024
MSSRAMDDPDDDPPADDDQEGDESAGPPLEPVVESEALRRIRERNRVINAHRRLWRL